MRRAAILATSVLTVGLALSAYFATHGGLGRVSPAPQPPADPQACTSTYLRNQCGAPDLPALILSGETAFRGRPVEIATSYRGVGLAGSDGRMFIHGRTQGVEIVCVTPSRALVRAATRELSTGDPVVLSGTVDQRVGKVVFLVNCTFWRG
jgi:hypothetical protein